MAFTIALKNRYEVLEEEESEQVDDDNVERESNVMMKAHTEADKTVLGKLRRKKERTDKRAWYRRQGGGRCEDHDMRTLYGLTKTLCNERSIRNGAVLDKEVIKFVISRTKKNSTLSRLLQNWYLLSDIKVKYHE